MNAMINFGEVPIKFRHMPYNKEGRYQRIHQQLQELFAHNNNILSRMATINTLLYHKMEGFFWVGFYLLQDERLLVGPYQGPLACLELAKNKGVCWTAINSGKTMVVPDVHKFPGHIACDSRSKSEIVILLKNFNHALTGVLDIDSNLVDHFDETDARHLERIAALVYQEQDLL